MQKVLIIADIRTWADFCRFTADCPLRWGDVFSPDKRQKRQQADSQNVSNISTTDEQNELTLRVEDMAFSYPITTSQILLFNALAVAVSPEFTKNAEMRTMYHDSMSQVDLATLSHLKDMLSLAHTKK